ncbi:MAG: LPS assembly protein LptD [Pseudomonadota bacterium]
MILLPALLALGASLQVVPEEGPPNPLVSDDQQAEGDVVFVAERIIRDETGQPIIAEGDVRATSDGQFLRADRLVYDPENDIVTAIGNVALRDESGQLYFAEEAVLTGDLRSGVIERFRVSLPPNGNVAAVTAVRRESGRNELRRSVFSLCAVCDEGLLKDRPTWQVKAQRAVQDIEAQRIRFYNAFVEVYGVPLLYVPYVQVPDPTAEKASGFLAPQISNSTRTGAEVEVPYYWAISDYQDLVFAPRYHSLLGTLFKGEWRRNTWNSGAVVQAGVINPTNDLSQEPGNPDDVRWHLFGSYTRQLPADWQVDVDVDAVSDKGYLLAYDIAPERSLQEENAILRPDRLDSSITFSKKTERSVTKLQGYSFQTLRFQEDQALTAQALPRLRHDRFYRLAGGDVDWSTSFLALDREDGLDTLRFSTSADYSALKVTKSGHRFEAFGQIRGDLYRFMDAGGGIQACNPDDADFEVCRLNQPRGLDEDAFTFARFLPTVGAEWSFPLARSGSFTSFIFEPKVQAVVSPQRDDTDDVFNEDSQFFQFDQVTLFDANKSTGLDRWEDGQRLNVGLNATAALGQQVTLNSTFGAQFRTDDTTVFGRGGGIGGERSDYVGSVDLRLGSNLIIDNRFRIDKDNFAFRRLENALRGRIGPFSGNLNYLRIQGDEEFSQIDQLDEFLTVGANVQLLPGVTIAATQAQNLDSGNTTNTQVALRLSNRCAALSFRYRFDDSTAQGFEANRVLLVRVDVLGLN